MENVHVINRGWAVKLEGHEGDVKTYVSKEDAVAAARKRARANESELLIHDRHGKIKRKHSFGHDDPSVEG